MSLEYICTHLQFGIHTRSNRSMHWNGYNDKPPDLSPVIISADPGSITRMLQQLQWDTLEERRARSRSIMLYRILNNLVEVPLHQYIQINTTRTRGSCAHNIQQISTRVDAYKYSFLPRTIITWNLLPPELRSQESGSFCLDYLFAPGRFTLESESIRPT